MAGRREKAPVAEAAAADPGAAAVAADGDDEDDDEERADGDVNARSCPPDTENHCRWSQAVPAPRTPRSLPPTGTAC